MQIPLRRTTRSRVHDDQAVVLHVRDKGLVVLTVSAHCTSWAAHQALAAGLPGAYRPNAVGSRFQL